MDQADVLEVFEQLLSRTQRESLVVGQYLVHALVPGSVFLGCSQEGTMALIVATVPSAKPIPPTRLAQLSADFGINCDLIEESHVETVRVSALQLAHPFGASLEIFATVCRSIASDLPENTPDDVFQARIADWVNLFWKLSSSATPDATGLAGELLLIATSTSPEQWVRAWHAEPNEVLDFVFGDPFVGVEVKTTKAMSRNHSISLAQVLDPRLESVYFASVQVDRSDSGTALSDLVRQIVDSLSDAEARAIFWSVVVRTCGQAIDETLAARFDLRMATESLAFYRAIDIPTPQVELPLPSGVSSVRFVSSFSELEDVTLDLH